MTLTRLREYCLSMPGATEQIQWGKDLVFKVGGKMFCVANTDPAGAEKAMSFKCDPETFAELCEREGMSPAPYMARAQWVALDHFDTLPERELQPLIARAYELIREKLPKKTQAALGQPAAPKLAKPPRRQRVAAKPAKATRTSGGGTRTTRRKAR